MGRMSPAERGELAEAIGRTYTASPELVIQTVRAARAARRDDVHDDLPAIARNLLEAERELAVIRQIIAQLVAETDHGYDRTIGDLWWKLQHAGIKLDDEYRAAEALVAAVEREGL